MFSCTESCYAVILPCDYGEGLCNLLQRFMDQISRSKKWLRRRGDVYEAVAVLLQPAHYRQYAWIELSIVRFTYFKHKLKCARVGRIVSLTIIMLTTLNVVETDDVLSALTRIGNIQNVKRMVVLL